MLPKNVAIAIRELVERMINDLGSKVVIGVWTAAESIDANLSQVQVTNELTYRYVPKVAGLSLAVGDQVIMVKGKGTPLVIVGEIVGDVNAVL